MLGRRWHLRLSVRSLSSVRRVWPLSLSSLPLGADLGCALYYAFLVFAARLWVSFRCSVGFVYGSL